MPKQEKKGGFGTEQGSFLVKLFFDKTLDKDFEIFILEVKFRFIIIFDIMLEKDTGLSQLKQEVFEYYLSHKKINSPIFGAVKLTPKALWHLENKDKKHKRTPEELQMRYKCFLLIDQLINQSHLYQEYKQEEQLIEIKAHKKKQIQLKKVKYFGLVAVVPAYAGHWIRIKVVIKKVSSRNSYEFVSVIPAWNMKGYHRLYFDENL